MESTDKLRKLADECYTFNDCSDKLVVIADEIEQEIAERYMELPVDADNVPINVGDMLIDTRFNEPFEVWAITDNQGLVSMKLSVCPTMYLKHVKPRTIEDVLKAFFHDALDADAFCTVRLDDVFAKYADELRNMAVGE